MAPGLLEPDMIVRDRWKVVKMLAEGGFGAVYRAVDVKDDTEVAIKVEPTSQPNPVLKVDVAVMLKLRGKTAHVCGILGAGKQGRYNFIVMSLVGPCLADLHRSRSKGCFNESTTIRIGRQCLTAIMNLHNVSFLHRDIKPGNFAIGRHGADRRIVYLLDFGLARWFKMKDAKGQILHREAREECGFRGTVRYASPNAHEGMELAQHDDIYSLLYMLVEFHRGELPWQNMEDDCDVARTKRNIPMNELLGDMEVEFNQMFQVLQSMKYGQRPDYGYFQNKFKAVQQRKKLRTKGPFEWEGEKEE